MMTFEGHDAHTAGANKAGGDMCVPINPIEELLKAIEIVHGEKFALIYRRFVHRWLKSKTEGGDFPWKQQ